MFFNSLLKAILFVTQLQKLNESTTVLHSIQTSVDNHPYIHHTKCNTLCIHANAHSTKKKSHSKESYEEKTRERTSSNHRIPSSSVSVFRRALSDDSGRPTRVLQSTLVYVLKPVPPLQYTRARDIDSCLPSDRTHSSSIHTVLFVCWFSKITPQHTVRGALCYAADGAWWRSITPFY